MKLSIVLFYHYLFLFLTQPPFVLPEVSSTLPTREALVLSQELSIQLVSFNRFKANCCNLSCTTGLLFDGMMFVWLGFAFSTIFAVQYFVFWKHSCQRSLPHFLPISGLISLQEYNRSGSYFHRRNV